VALRLRLDAMRGIDEQNRQVSGRCAGCHIARVLFVAGRIGEDELALGGGEIAIRDVDRDPLFAFGLQPVGEERKVNRSGATVLRCGAH
jgi:hypothetical protein